jgi:hypothetical protein
MEAYCQASITDIDPSVYSHIILASFSSISCRVFAVRQLGEDLDQVCISTRHILVCLIVRIQSEARQRICRDIQEFKVIVNSTRSKNYIRDTAEEDRLCSLTHVALVFETEQRCILKDWAAVLASIEVSGFLRLPTCGTHPWHPRKLLDHSR